MQPGRHAVEPWLDRHVPGVVADRRRPRRRPRRRRPSTPAGRAAMDRASSFDGRSTAGVGWSGTGWRRRPTTPRSRGRRRGRRSRRRPARDRGRRLRRRQARSRRGQWRPSSDSTERRCVGSGQATVGTVRARRQLTRPALPELGDADRLVGRAEPPLGGPALVDADGAAVARHRPPGPSCTTSPSRPRASARLAPGPRSRRRGADRPAPRRRAAGRSVPAT